MNEIRRNKLHVTSGKSVSAEDISTSCSGVIAAGDSTVIEKVSSKRTFEMRS